jgi:site-specific recombinase XerD
MNAHEVEAFLNHLATARQVSASTQNQALNALVFLYRDVLDQQLGEMPRLRRVQRRHRVPVILTREEVRRVLQGMTGTTKLMAELIYGAGLRVTECVTLRIKDIDFGAKTISVRNGKGGKDRTTMLPEQLVSPLQQYLLRVLALHRRDLARGTGLAPLPDALWRKHPSASRSVAWQFVFPSALQRPWGSDGRLARWHASDSAERSDKSAQWHRISH